MRSLAVAMALCAAGGAHAWEEPERESTDRAGLMDALRPQAEWLLAPPVDFVIYELRQDGDVGFSSVAAVRPGGMGIDI